MRCDESVRPDSQITSFCPGDALPVNGLRSDAKAHDQHRFEEFQEFARFIECIRPTIGEAQPVRERLSEPNLVNGSAREGRECLH